MVVYEVVDKYRTESLKFPPYVNPIVAAFTTSYARLLLYEGLTKVKPTLLGFCDTDSILFAFNPEEGRAIKLGETLGSFCDEIAKEFGSEAILLEACNPGPKQGSRRILIPSSGTFEHQICRGFARTAAFEDNIHHDLMKKLVLGEKSITPVPYNKFIRDRKTMTVHTLTENKVYKAVQDKRINLPGSVITFPFGFSNALAA